jgi:MurNAc alpha-1-phosphate uridylyltransferase
MLPCAILCGGLATRLRPVTEKIPKSLIPINGEPFITHQLRLLKLKGVTHVVLCVGYLGEMIQEFVGTGTEFGLNVSYSFDGVPLLGTAGAIRKALPLLDSAFFVLYGDSYLTCDYGDVAEAFNASKARGLMTIYRNEGRFDTSNVEADGGLILRYDKRNRTSGMHYIDYGLGVFSESVFSELPANEIRDLTVVYQNLCANGALAGYEVKERFYEIGSEQGIRDLERYLAGQSSGAEASGQRRATNL